MNAYQSFSTLAARQRGAVLVVSLMILIILTMLGISTITSTKLETKMAANVTESNYAFQVAELGIAEPRDSTSPDYSAEKVVEIAKGTPKRDDQTVFRNKLEGISSYVEFITVALTKKDYPAPKGVLWGSKVSFLYYITRSIGYSNKPLSAIEKKNMPKVILRAGMVQPVPIDSVKKTSIKKNATSGGTGGSEDTGDTGSDTGDTSGDTGDTGDTSGSTGDSGSTEM